MKNAFFYLLIIPVLSILLMSSNCKQESQTTSVDATVHVNVMSRGAYQYLIRTKDNTYMCENLATEFQKDNLAVTLDYKVLDKKAMVYKPGPTDVPQEDYEVTLIEIINIKPR